MIRSLLVGEKKNIDIAKTFIVTALIGVLTQIIASFLLTIILDSFFPKTAEEYEQSISTIIQITPLMLLQVCIIFPIMEELVFRLALLGTLERFVPFILANVIQALVFGIYHGNIVQGIYAFLLGMFIGYLYYLTGGVLYTISFHIFLNLFGMFIDKLIPADTSLLINGLLCLVSLVIVGGLVLFIKRK